MSINLEDLSFRHLQKVCRGLEIKAVGSTKALRSRITKFIAQNDAEADFQTIAQAVVSGKAPPTPRRSKEEASEDDASDDEQDEEDEQEQNGEQDDDEEDVTDDEDEDEDDIDDAALERDVDWLDDDTEQEVVGLLIRNRKRGADGEEDEDELLFIDADDLEDVLSEETGDDDSDIIGDDEIDPEFLDYDEDAEEDDEDDEDFEGPSGANASRLWVQVFCAVEVVCFIYHLTVQQVPAEPASDGETVHTPHTVMEMFLQALVVQVFTYAFWASLIYFFSVFFALPYVFGLLFGDSSTPENVFGYCLSRLALQYLLHDFGFFFAWDVYPFQLKIFNVACFVPMALAFWEKRADPLALWA